MYGTFQTMPPRNLPKIAFGFMLAYLSSLHIYRMVVDYMGYKLDATGLIMVLTIKITLLACNYCDGKRMDTEGELLIPTYKEFAITQLPTVIEYYSYLLYFPTFLSGPAFHYSTYLQWINDKLYVNEKYNPSGKMPDPTWAVLEALGLSIILVVTHLVLSAMFPIEILFHENGMDHIPLIVRYLYIEASLVGIRCRYYFIWKLSEGAGVITGLGFSGYDKNGKPTWLGLTNSYIFNIESMGCLRDITTYWNYKTGEWLKNYVYLRQTRNPNTDKIPGYSLYLTNTLSAFWHGFYPGYYMSFVYAAVTVNIARQVRAIFRPLVTKNTGKPDEIKLYPQFYVYDIVGRFLTVLIFNYGFVSFVGLSFSRAMIAYSNLAYTVHIVLIVSFILLQVYDYYMPPKKKEQ